MTPARAAAVRSTKTATENNEHDIVMTNAEIAAVFTDIAALLKAKKENIFKVRAYQKAAGFITDWPVSIEQLASAGRLREVPGVGEAIEKKITELIATGRLEFYEKLKASSVITRSPDSIGTTK